ncbi:hypothetical protein BIW11_07912 [Tropilaelaps mercedesae]|uniref:Uncharacterized protein n=1 Tax=Tropilaelaps mercedesae TaxID=418985 RepID=A0A1V9XRV6_9ACAR|nr:hypothetical protein BIW11_07912 [Tropilaelaps mercedesae]
MSKVLQVALCLMVLQTSSAYACMATTRMSRYVPSVSLYWWRSNVTALNRTLPVGFVTSDRVNQTSTQTNQIGDSVINGQDDEKEPQDTTTIPLLPMRVEQSTHRPKYYRVLASSEIPMPKPLFVVPYSPSPALTPASTEDPQVLWNKILGPPTPATGQVELPGPTPWWTSVRVSSVPGFHPAGSSNLHAAELVNVPMFTQLPDSNLERGPEPPITDSTSNEGIQLLLSTSATQIINGEKECNATEVTTLENDIVDKSSSVPMSREKLLIGNSDSDSTSALADVTNDSILTTENKTSMEDVSITTSTISPTNTTVLTTTDHHTITRSFRLKKPKPRNPTVTRSTPAMRATARPKILSSFIQTMPVNSVILVVGDEQQHKNLLLETSADLQAQESASHPVMTTANHGTPKQVTTTDNRGPLFDANGEPTTTVNNTLNDDKAPKQPDQDMQQPETAPKVVMIEPEIIALENATIQSEVESNTDKIINAFLETNDGLHKTNSDITTFLKSSAMAVNITDNGEPFSKFPKSAQDSTNMGWQIIDRSIEFPTLDSVSVEITSAQAEDVPTATSKTADTTENQQPNIASSDVHGPTNDYVTELSGSDTTQRDSSVSVIAHELAKSTDSELGFSKTLATEVSISPVYLNRSSLIDAFQGSIISARTAHSSDATRTSEPPMINGTERIRLVSEEEVLLERIPHSLPPGEDRHSALQGDSIISSVLEIINASSYTEKPKGIFSFSPTLAAILNHARVRKESSGG